MKKMKGFTLIELLIVIALLGALAIGLLATIDPFEQLKKGRDTSTRNTVSEFYNANLRYYAIKGQFPWGGSNGTDVTAGTLTQMTAGVVQTLIDSGELKQRFSDLAAGAARRIMINSTAREHLAVCFDPESKAFDVDPNTIYDESGGTTITNCKSMDATGNPNCFYCIE